MNTLHDTDPTPGGSMKNTSGIEVRAYALCNYVTDSDTGAVCDRRVTGWAADEGGAVIITACADHADEGTTDLAALLGLATGAALDRRVEAVLARGSNQ